jgi:hypothetical protein
MNFKTIFCVPIIVFKIFFYVFAIPEWISFFLGEMNLAAVQMIHQSGWVGFSPWGGYIHR